MNAQEMKIIAENNGYENTEEMIKEKCPSEMGYIDYGTVGEYCIGEYNKKICTKCWRESACAEEIDDNETFMLTRKAFDTDEDYAEYLKRLEASKAEAAAEKQQEAVNHPSHYSQAGRRECIEEMRLMFGDEKVYWWCVMTAYKYRYRMGNKDGNPSEQDERKAEWYLDYAESMQKVR